LHSEFTNTDPDGRVHGVRAPVQREKKEAWRMIAVSYQNLLHSLSYDLP